MTSTLPLRARPSELQAFISRSELWQTVIEFLKPEQNNVLFIC